MPRVCIRCSRPAVPGRSRCQLHGGGDWVRVTPESKAHYDAAWRELRARVLREEPNCRVCGAKATDVDHIVALADGGSNDRGNLRALCRKHHKEHTAAQNKARRERRKQKS
jgi:5-methylcytosine-specific restriction endonuclease McrA